MLPLISASTYQHYHSQHVLSARPWSFHTCCLNLCHRPSQVTLRELLGKHLSLPCRSPAPEGQSHFLLGPFKPSCFPVHRCSLLVGHRERATCARRDTKIHVRSGCLPELSFGAQSQKSHQTLPLPLPLCSGCSWPVEPGAGGPEGWSCGCSRTAQLWCEETWACVYQHRAQCYRATPLPLWALRL